MFIQNLWNAPCTHQTIHFILCNSKNTKLASALIFRNFSISIWCHTIRVWPVSTTIICQRSRNSRKFFLNPLIQIVVPWYIFLTQGNITFPCYTKEFGLCQCNVLILSNTFLYLNLLYCLLVASVTNCYQSLFPKVLSWVTGL